MEPAPKVRVNVSGNTSGSNNIARGYQTGLNITTGSSNIDIGNQGLSTDTNIIRIGSGQSQTFIAGVINGNGGGLTHLNVSAAQLTGGANGNLFVGPAGNEFVNRIGPEWSTLPDWRRPRLEGRRCVDIRDSSGQQPRVCRGRETGPQTPVRYNSQE